MKNLEKKFVSTIQAAKVLGISRIAVFKRIKKGKLKATQIGRGYLIFRSELKNALKNS